MREILLVAHHYPPHVGGLEVVVERQARSLAESGFRVTVLTSSVYGQETLQAVAGIDVIRIKCWHVFERYFFIPFPLFSPRIVIEAWRQLKRAEVVHLHDVFYLSSWIVALLARKLGKPILLTQHVAMVEHQSRLVMWMQRLIYATVGRWIFKQARSIVAYNDTVQSFLRKFRVPDERILRLTNGIDTDLFRPALLNEREEIRHRYGLPLDRRLVLFVGRLVEKKGFRLLLEAKDASFDLVFVGPGPIPDACRESGVHWLGPMSQAEAAELYRACDLFALPAIGEVFTLAMQESMSSGLPVVTTDDPAYSNSVVAGHVVLCDRQAKSLSGAIRGLLADPDRLDYLSVRGREIALANFNWSANIASLMHHYLRYQRSESSL